jgi:hypothetical protein
MTVKELVSKIEECGFSCETGPLTLCRDWIALGNHIAGFGFGRWSMGDKVEFEVKGEVDGVAVVAKTLGWITAMRFASDSERRFIEYGITSDLTGPYHSGKPAKWWRKGDEINYARLTRA